MLVRMELSMPRDARYVGMMRDVARCVLTDLGAPTEARDDIEIAVTEACANAVRHASGVTDYQVALAVSMDGCEVEVADLGPGFDLGHLDRVEDEIDLEDESGRGLVLISALVDDLEFVRQEQGTRLRLQKRWTDLDLALDTAATGQRG
jgi:serine/threonine-protein kinase RsbW